jgi:hypothetical protein
MQPRSSRQHAQPIYDGVEAVELSIAFSETDQEEIPLAPDHYSKPLRSKHTLPHEASADIQQTNLTAPTPP